MERVTVLKTKIFWKFFLPYLVIFSVLFAAAILIFEYKIKPILSQNSEKTLAIEVMVIEESLARLLEYKSLDKLHDYIETMAEKTSTSIAILDNEANVLFNSQLSEIDEKNFAETTEIMQASKLGSGSASRMDPVTGAMIYYAARQLGSKENPRGYVRTSMSTLSSEISLGNTRNILIGVIFFGGLIGLFLGYRRSKRFTVPIYQMKQVCEALQKGKYSEKVTSISKDELGKLGETLNQLANEITKKIETISFERAQLKTILASMVEGIVSLDDKNKLQFCNSAAYSLVGSDLRDGRNQPLHTLKGFKLLADLAEKARRTKVLENEEIHIQEEGISKVLECYASTFKTGDGLGVIIVLHNVTELRHLERVRRDFVANASHEIKTPLTNIKGYAETLLSGALEDAHFAQKFVEKIDNNASRLKHLVQDLLSLARIEAHEEGIRIIPSNWNQVVKQGLSQYEDSIAEKHLKVSLDESSLSTQLFGDPDCMSQIFDNLLTNSIRYTPDGGEIRISCSKNDKYCLLHVEDTGIGISQKHLERIFERFYRVDKARSRELGGTGLGLAIVKHLVTNMNGKIFVTSEVGMGSKFTIALKSSG